MAMFIGPTHTGWNGQGWIKQPLTQEQTFLRMDLAEALKRKNDGRAHIDDRRAAQSGANELVKQLKARKDQSRVGGLPPGPLPPEGDVTVIEKGAGPQPTMLPVGVAAGPERPFTPVPEDRFAQPDNTQLATAQQIRDAYDRRQSQKIPAEPMIAEAPSGVPDPAMVIADQPEPAAPEPQVADADPSPAPARVPEPTFRSAAKLPAGMRNANPGNLKYSGSAWQRRNFPGMLGPSTTHGAGNTDQGDPQIAFRSHMDGMKAAVHLARTKFRSGKNTVYSLIAGPGGWTPGYGPAASNIARNMGVGVNDPINLDNPQVMGSFMRALLLQEHGEASKAYTDDFLMAAIAGGETPDPEITDESWISGGATRSAHSASSNAPAASRTRVMAYSQENTMDPTMDPQAGLVQALLAQQRASEMGYAQPQGGGNWAPMVGPAPTELAQETPIVAGGGNARPVSFGGGQVASPDQIDQRRAVAEALMARGTGMQQIDHPLQGAARVANAAAGAYGMHRANQQENQYRDQLAQALIGVQNGGSADALARLEPRIYMQVQQQQAAQQAHEAELARQEAIREQERQEWYNREAYKQANPARTDDQREYQQAQEQGYVGTFAEYQKEMKAAGRSVVSIDQRGEGAYAKTAGEGLAKQNLEEATRGRDAGQTLDRISTMRASIAQMDDQGAVAGIQRLLGERGIHVGPDVPEQELMVSLREAMIPGLHVTPGPMTDSDARMYRMVLPRLLNTKEGNMLILDMMEGAARYDAEVGRIARQRLSGATTDDEYYDQIEALGSPQKLFVSRIREFREASPEFQQSIQMLETNRDLFLDQEEYSSAIDAIRQGADPGEIIRELTRGGR